MKLCAPLFRLYRAYVSRSVCAVSKRWERIAMTAETLGVTARVVFLFEFYRKRVAFMNLLKIGVTEATHNAACIS